MRVSPPPNAAPSGDVQGPPTLGILSTYPPTACGLATFSAALTSGLVAHGADVHVVRIADGSRSSDPRVRGELVPGSPPSIAASAQLLNRCDVAIIQHEYGVYGGMDGDDVVDVIGALEIPAVVVAHTVLRDPTPHQRSVLVEVARLAERVVVMSESARSRLLAGFDVDPARVVTIPHGALVPDRMQRPKRAAVPTMLTWGLLGPGKGIERAIDAMADLRDLRPRPRYVIAGQTHPKVLAAHGDVYRDALAQQAFDAGVAESVVFDATYRDVTSLTSLIRSADVVVLPYDSADQVTSGVLVDAVACGRPVVATAFPHAVELLSSGAGIVVDHGDPDALASALRRVLTEPGLAAHMAAEAARLAPRMGWPVVAAAYVDLAGHLRTERPALV